MNDARITRGMLYHYKEYKARIESLNEKILILRALAEKTTPTLSDDTSHSSETDSKVERNVVKIVELELELSALQTVIKRCDEFLLSLKPYQRSIVRACIIDHVPYTAVAKKNRTTPQNISLIIKKSLKEKSPN